MGNDRIIECLEKIIEDLKKTVQEDAKAYVAENFKTLLDDVAVMMRVSWTGEILSMYLPYESELAKKADEACGTRDYEGFYFEYEGYNIWISRECQVWRLRVGPFPEKYPKRIEFIKKHVSNIDTSEVERIISSFEYDIKDYQEKIEKYKEALREIGR